MDIKYPFFPQEQQAEEDNTRQEHAGRESQEHSHAGGQFRRQANKGHAAYAAKGKSSPGEESDLRVTEAGYQEGDQENLLAHVAKEALQSACLARLCPECQVKKEADDVRLRSLAELDNAKKRLARERDEQARFAAEAVLADIIPSLDNLDLALLHAGDNNSCKDLLVGVQMTRKLLFETLQKHGLKIVGAVGEPFDPAVHEAVGMTDSPDTPNGHVCALVSKGYTLRERLLQPARVVVCKKD
ncbi:MAG: nucleotide exchange factor GrpE [Desulfovibrio sp.]|jgi:molecular chaperone GrpE|nr:nucleotide exchange factor GrpE [Desulfovibrio sp.]